jgi:hypothetical protein
MNFYITVDDKEKIKKAFLNIRKQLVIDVFDFIRDLGYDTDDLDQYASYIVSEKIKKTIQTAVSNNRAQSIIYINPEVDHEAIRELIHFVQENTKVEKTVLLTDKGKNEDLYELFEEVLFYPSVKKVKIIECTPIPVVWLD